MRVWVDLSKNLVGKMGPVTPEERRALDHLEALTPDQLDDIFASRLDGIWSRQTRAAAQKLGAHRQVKLDRHWSLTPADWTCPCCRRHKRDCFRTSDRSSASSIIATLNSHHDHVADLVTAELDRFFDPVKIRRMGPDAIEREAARRSSMQSTLLAISEKFRPTLVCQDCNGADALVKARKRELPRWFSFSPSEIRRFIVAAPNEPHEVDPDRAMAIFEAQAASVAARPGRISAAVEDMACGLVPVRETAPDLRAGDFEPLVLASARLLGIPAEAWARAFRRISSTI